MLFAMYLRGFYQIIATYSEKLLSLIKYFEQHHLLPYLHLFTCLLILTFIEETKEILISHFDYLSVKSV